MILEFDFPEVADKRDIGFICPCCQLYVKRYTRSFNSNMALALIALYNSRDKEFIHVESLMSKLGYKRPGDFSYLRHYSLIEPKAEDREDGSSRNGFYKITGRGILFVEQKLKVQAKFLIFNNKCEGFKGKDISITDAIGTKFNYSELMASTNWDSYIN